MAGDFIHKRTIVVFNEQLQDYLTIGRAAPQAQQGDAVNRSEIANQNRLQPGKDHENGRLGTVPACGDRFSRHQRTGGLTGEGQRQGGNA